MNPLGVAVVLSCLLRIPAGIGAFTFVYAKGYSYLSTDPRTCLNCHISSRGTAGSTTGARASSRPPAPRGSAEPPRRRGITRTEE